MTGQTLNDLRQESEDLDEEVAYWEGATLHLLGCKREIADCKTCQAIQKRVNAK